MRRTGLGLAAAMAAALLGPDGSPPASRLLPRFTADGALEQPAGFRDWVLAGASLGLSYAEPARDAGPGLFHNVYIEPGALAAYRRDGGFPEGTILMMELFRAGQKAEPAKGGYYEAESVGVEAAVKDSARFEGGWAYFSFGDGRRPSARAFAGEACAGCHRAHAATDNVFTQFYPALRRPAQR
jgi:hypothetical protein